MGRTPSKITALCLQVEPTVVVTYFLVQCGVISPELLPLVRKRVARRFCVPVLLVDDLNAQRHESTLAHPDKPLW